MTGACEKRRAYHLGKRYGITPEEFAVMEDRQNGCCALCLEPPETRPLVVDHNHFTGKVRALLCLVCNAKLHAVEDEQFLLRALEYLSKHGQEFLVKFPERSA